jgi:DNA-binding MarR family transcriptional regulator
MSQYTDEIKDQAKEVWTVMNREAANRGMALQKVKPYGDGRVIISTVGAFISALNAERDWDLNETKKRLIREFLKATHNVVVQVKVEQYKYRIFVRKEWNDAMVFAMPVGDKPSRTSTRLTPHDLGEDREPGEVSYRCVDCSATFETFPSLRGHRSVHSRSPLSNLSDDQVRVLRAIAKIDDATYSLGVTREIASLVELKNRQVTEHISRLKKRGLVETEGRERRHTSVRLTAKGKKLLKLAEKNRPHLAVTEAPASEPVPESPKLEVVKPVDEASVAPSSDTLDEYLLQIIYDLLRERRKKSVAERKLQQIRTYILEVGSGQIWPFQALGLIEELLRDG